MKYRVPWVTIFCPLCEDFRLLYGKEIFKSHIENYHKAAIFLTDRLWNAVRKPEDK